jgi:hypothetical protein
VRTLLVGGPEDGHEVNVSAAMPLVILVAAEPPSVYEVISAGDVEPFAPSYPVHRYRLERCRFGPLLSFRYVYEGTS